jgi:hypothetical protein
LYDYIRRFEEGKELLVTSLPPWPLDSEVDFKIYVARVVQSLYVEANKIVPWSILEYDDSQLLLLFQRKGDQGYDVVNWNPKGIYDFCRRTGIVGLSRSASVVAFGDWCRRHLKHFTAGETPLSLYGYDAPYAPLDRILSGFSLVAGKQFVTFGCWGTTSIWKEVMATINIPVDRQNVTFAQPSEQPPYGYHSYFTISSIQLGVSHGDDFYDRTWNVLSGGMGHLVPTELLFVSLAYLNDSVLNPTQLDCNNSVCNNKAQQALFNTTQLKVMLDVQFLTDHVLNIRVQDWDSLKSPQNLMDYLTGVDGQIYAKPLFSEEQRIIVWKRVDSCLSAMGNGDWMKGAQIVGARYYSKIPALPSSIILVSPYNDTEVSGDSLYLSWLEGYEAVSRYLVEMSTDSLFTARTMSYPTTRTGLVIHDLLKANTYWWRVQGQNSSGWGPFSGVWKFYRNLTSIEGNQLVPKLFVLDQNYPNPFNPSTTIRYVLPQRSHVTLAVFNTLGQQVAVLQNGEQEAGYHEVKFDGSGLSSGVYFYRIQAGSFVETRKLLLIR